MPFSDDQLDTLRYHCLQHRMETANAQQAHSKRRMLRRLLFLGAALLVAALALLASTSGWSDIQTVAKR